ncbi:MAG TPA: hypothetical protein VK071_09855 [Tissierellales bacterium]|nr:hypothetical protein [Tissierellales bacterium]
MRYKSGNLLIISDFEIRLLKEEELDIDLLIPLNFRTLNLHIEGLPKYINRRIQFPRVRNIVIRFTKIKGNEFCTIHILNSIDFQSAIANFEVNYEKHCIRLEKKEYSVEMYIKKKEI